MPIVAEFLDFTNNVAGLALLLYAAFQHPFSQRSAAFLWRHLHRRLVAQRESLQAAPLWAKACIGLGIAWAIGGFTAFSIAAGPLLETETLQLWILCWFGSMSLVIWAGAGWLGCLGVGKAGRWAWKRVR